MLLHPIVSLKRANYNFIVLTLFRLLFEREHLRMPDNLGEKRESLVILEKVGLTKGLLESIATDPNVSKTRLTFQRPALSETSRTLRADKNCNYNSSKFNCSNTFISFGANTRKLPKTRSAFDLFKSALLDDDLVRLLLLVATFSFVVSFFANEANGWVPGVSIYIAVLFMSTITTICNLGKQSQFKSLHMQIQAEQVTVVRGQYGVSTQIPVKDLVVGDIVLLS